MHTSKLHYPNFTLYKSLIDHNSFINFSQSCLSIEQFNYDEWLKKYHYFIFIAEQLSPFHKHLLQ